MENMTGYLLPLSDDPWQVFTMDLTIDGEEFHAQTELRYLPAPDMWFLSIRDHSSGELLVNMIPVICSYGEPNDLFQPFRHLRNGKGLGSFLCLRGTEDPSTSDPSKDNLTAFNLLWSDTFQ